jgi:hypothetical protein
VFHDLVQSFPLRRESWIHGQLALELPDRDTVLNDVRVEPKADIARSILCVRLYDRTIVHFLDVALERRLDRLSDIIAVY